MEEAIEGLRELAAKLGQTVEYLWPEYIRFIVWKAAIPVVLILLIWVACVFFFARAMRELKNLDEQKYEEIKAREAMAIIVGVCLFLSTLTMLIVVGDNVPRMMAPVGAATQDIINAR